VISNSEKLITDIIFWIKEQIKKRRAKGLCIAGGKDINSVLTAILCKKTGIKTEFVYDYETAINLNRKFVNISNFNLNLKGAEFLSESYDLYADEADQKQLMLNAYWVHYVNKNNYLLIGTYDKEELLLNDIASLRLIDIVPLADLYKSEINTLSAKMEIIKHDDYEKSFVEWASRENDSNNIFESQDPSKHKDWQRYTAPQRQDLALLHQQVAQNKCKNKMDMFLFRKENDLVY